GNRHTHPPTTATLAATRSPAPRAGPTRTGPPPSDPSPHRPHPGPPRPPNRPLAPISTAISVYARPCGKVNKFDFGACPLLSSGAATLRGSLRSAGSCRRRLLAALAPL